MKTFQNKFKTVLFLLFVGFAFSSCSSNDSGDTTTPEPKNQVPNSFKLVEVTNGATQPQLSWDAATDPEDDAVSYDVYLGTTTSPSSKGSGKTRH